MTDKNSEENVAVVPLIFSYLGMIACTLFTFFGLAYTFGGNIWVAGFGAVLALVILWVLSNRLLGEKTTKRRKTDNSTEYILLGVYVVVFVVLLPFNFQSVDIEISQKDAIIKAGNGKIADITDLINKFKKFVSDSTERLRSQVESNTAEIIRVSPANKDYYLGKVKEQLGEIKIDLSALKASPDDDETQKSVKMAIESATKLKITDIEASLYKDNLKKAFEDFEKEGKPDAESVFAEWNRLRIGQEFAMLDEKYKKLQNHTKANSAKFQHNPVSAQTVSMNNPVSNLTNATVGSLLLILVLLVVVHLCLLAPYLTVERAESGNGLVRKNKTHIQDDLN